MEPHCGACPGGAHCGAAQLWAVGQGQATLGGILCIQSFWNGTQLLLLQRGQTMIVNDWIQVVAFVTANPSGNGSTFRDEPD